MWWDRACKNLGVEDVWLMAEQNTCLAKALGPILAFEEIKRGGNSSRTKKAFDCYYQPYKREHVRVITAIKKLKKVARGELIDLKNKNN